MVKSYKIGVLAWEAPGNGRVLTGSGIYLNHLTELANLRENGHGLDLTFIVPWWRDLRLWRDGYEVFLIGSDGFSKKHPYSKETISSTCKSFADKMLNGNSHVNLKKFDLVLSNGFGFGELIARAQHLENIIYISHRPEFLRKSIANKFGVAQDKERVQRDTELEMKAVRGANQVITVSNACKKELVRGYRRRRGDVKVIYNGVDTSLFKRVNTHSRKKTIFTYVGRNDPEKGVFLLLEGAKDLVEQEHEGNFELQLITNDGGLLQRKIKRLGISPHVRQMRWKKHKNLPKHYSKPTFTIIPSYWESFSYVTAESLSCQTPVITSTAGALPEISNQKVGLSFDTGDKENLVKQLVRACRYQENRVEQMGREGRERVQRSFSKEKFLQNYLHFLESILYGIS
ncbi:MAG: glycosyltransferase family 4 protein [Candidatus Hadarchaeota archaeon]|nr:glycosyltransferase family 4 protein [Candidatus Hadarchaeota archaeon]